MACNVLRTLIKYAQSIKDNLSRWRVDRKTLSSLRRYGSQNLCSQEFNEYWQACRRESPVAVKHTSIVDKAVRSFFEHGISSWSTEKSRTVADKVYFRLLQEEKADLKCWDKSLRYNKDALQAFPEIECIFHDSLSEFLSRYYGTHYKLFYCVLYKSVSNQGPPTGSSLWHRDGGPGTCINVMFGISPLSKANGALSCISEKDTLQLSTEVLSNSRKCDKQKDSKQRAGQSKNDIRQETSDYIDRTILLEPKCSVIQPIGESGLIIPFRNNNFHMGGDPESGETRYVCIFHAYPSGIPPDWSKYRSNGLRKAGSFPDSPAQEF